jgi:hypothetical protein
MECGSSHWLAFIWALLPPFMMMGQSEASATRDDEFISCHDTLTVDSASKRDIHNRIKEAISIKGTTHIGVRYGNRPFGVSDVPKLTPMMMGSVELSLFNVPFSMGYDIGSDISSRGWRNQVTFRLNTSELKERARMADANELGALDGRIDSLNQVRSNLERKIQGLLFQVDQSKNSKAPPFVVHDLGPDSLANDTSLDQFGTQGLQDLEHTKPGNQLEFHSRRDSLNELLNDTQSELESVQGVIKDLLQIRSTRIPSPDDQLGHSSSAGFLSTIRKFELGNIMPTGSSFLLNGTTMQGISYQYLSRSIFISLDAGRSFDETWATRDQSSIRLRRLQETIFLQDGREFGPKKLASVRIGIGTPESTHFHVGVLRGSRSVDGMITQSGSGVPRLLNHVVEIDGALEVAKGHSARIAIARSVVADPSSARDGDSPLQAALARRTEQNQAVQLGWASRFKATGTDINVTARSIDSMFQSMGVAFIRPASRSIDVVGTQPIGKHIKIKAGYKAEERKAAQSSAINRIKRYRAQVLWKVERSLNLRMAYLPMEVRTTLTDGSSNEQENHVLQLGGDLRRKVGDHEFLLALDGARYLWPEDALNAGSGEAYSWNLVVSIRKGKWSMGLTGYTFSDSDPNEKTSTTAGMDLSWHDDGRIEADARITIGQNGPEGIGWSTSLMKHLSKTVMITCSGGRSVQAQFLTVQDFGNLNEQSYYCEVAVGLIW